MKIETEGSDWGFKYVEEHDAWRNTMHGGSHKPYPRFHEGKFISTSIDLLLFADESPLSICPLFPHNLQKVILLNLLDSGHAKRCAIAHENTVGP